MPNPNPNQESLKDLRSDLFDVLNCYTIDASEVGDGTTYIDSGEAHNILDQLMPLIAKYQATIDQRVAEARNQGQNDMAEIDNLIFHTNDEIEISCRKREQAARIDEVKRSLHKGYFIPEMEVYAEDRIATLTQKEDTHGR